MERSIIKDFYKNQNVFVTGGTGFLGKVLIEKLLRTTEVSKIYILVRQKKGACVEDRLRNLFQETFFDRMKRETDGYEDKIFGIEGDCSLPNLGLSKIDENALIETVDVVFHVAATVRFDEKLRLAYETNFRGTKDCVEFGRRMRNLKAFVHVSTAYSNYILENVEEKFYDYAMNAEDIESFLYQLDDDEIQKKLSDIMGEWPFSYVFTKQLTENFIRKNSDGIPIGIFRPSIVTCAYKEPIEGWIDNFNGPTALSVLLISGILKTAPVDFDKAADFVPVDYCVSCMIASAWDIYERSLQSTNWDVPIYNYVSTPENPITWGEYANLITMHGYNYPFLKYPMPISLTGTLGMASEVVFKTIYHYAPALILDLLGLIILRKPSFFKQYQKIHKHSKMLAFFTTRSWNFTNENVVKLWSKLNETDKALFPFSAKEIQWLPYIRNYVKGMRQYILNDPLDTVEQARIKQKRILIIYNLLKGAIVYALCVLVHTKVISLFKRLFCRL